MKRDRATAFAGSRTTRRPPSKITKTTVTSVNAPFKVPRRAYKGSQVPVASRGYAFGSTEMKVADQDAIAMDANTTGDFQLLYAPTPGTDMTNRIGRKIVARSILIRGRVQINPSTNIANWANTLPQTVRMILFVDYQPNGAEPVITDLLKTASPLAPLNLDNRDRFKVLRDKMWSLGPMMFDNTAAMVKGSSEKTVTHFKLFKKCEVETIFNAGSAGTIADITSGAVYLFFCGSIAAGALDSVATIHTRVRFEDK